MGDGDALMRTRSDEREGQIAAAQSGHEALRPVDAIGPNGAGKGRIRSDHQDLLLLVGHFAQSGCGHGSAVGAKMAVDHAPAGRKPGDNRHRVGSALRVSEEQHGRQARPERTRRPARGASKLAPGRRAAMFGHVMSSKPEPDLAARRVAILAQLEALSNGRCQLVAASKRQPDARIDAVLAAGQRVFGENRVQEAAARWAPRRGLWPDLQLRLIGPLQTNKAEDAVRLFDVIETLDRPRLAAALGRAMAKTGRRPSVLIQVNTGEEPQKSGVAPRDLDALYRSAIEEHGLSVTGLMCIPPAAEPAGPHFALLAKLADRYGLAQRSMGMSGDYGLAARLGATHVRIGTALFGERNN